MSAHRLTDTVTPDAMADGIGVPEPVTRPPEQTAPRAYSVKEFCRVFGVGKTFAHTLMSAGVLKRKYAGKRLLITADSAQNWFEALPDEPPRKRVPPPTKLSIAR